MSRLLTHCGNDLGLHAKLVLEPSCEIADSTATIACNIWYSSDVVEHMATSEQ